MQRKRWVSLAALTVGLALLVAAVSAGTASSKSPRTTSAYAHVGKAGGTFNINMSATDIDFADPALSYSAWTWPFTYEACSMLLSYPDKPAPEGSVLTPDGAAAMPVVANKGQTYIFTVRDGLKFSDGTPVTAANYAFAINRDLNPSMQSPAAPFISDIVGAEDVLNGKAKTATGVKVVGNKLSVTLSKPSPDFLARIAMPFFCPLKTDTPITAQGVDTFAGSGPYYFASRTPNRSLVLKKNPFYKGPRPANFDQFVVTANTDLDQSLLQVQSGQADYDIAGLPPTAHEDLGNKYGINKSQYWVHPMIETDYLALNTSSGRFFADKNARFAANTAIDRPAMLRARGKYAGKRTDQILPPGMAGFKDAKIWPIKGADPNGAKKYYSKGGAITIYTGNRGAALVQGQVLQYNFKQIGIDATIKQFTSAVLYSKAGTKGEPFDAVLAGWGADYPDPLDFMDILLNGNNIHDTNNNNLAYFNDPTYNARMEAAAKLSGPTRYSTYGQLDIDITKNAAPWASYDNRNMREFTSSRLDPKCYVFQPVYQNMDLGAACLK